MQALLNEDALAVRRGRIGLHHELVELVEITLRKVAGAVPVGVLNLDCDDAALFVLGDFGDSRKMLCSVNTVALAVNVLQIEAIDEVTGDRVAAQQVNEQVGRSASSNEASGEAAKRSEAAHMPSQRSQHHGA